MTDTELDEEYRSLCSDALESGDWHGAYLWAKGWIGNGGAGLVDPWLVYVASALLHGQPRNATHSVDLALGGWFETASDRAVLHFVRSRVVWLRLHDPKTALLDLAPAQTHAPSWLIAEVNADEKPMRAAAAASRKRKPSVAPAPEFHGVTDRMADLALRRQGPGTRPDLWDVLYPFIGPASPH